MNEKHKNIKVLQILPALETGGVERGTIEIASFLKNKEITNFVASSGGKMVRELDKIGVKHFNLPLNTKNPIQILFNAAKIAKIIRNHQINIVHARSRAPAYSAYLAAKKTNAHFITTYHGTYGFGLLGLKKIYNQIMVKGEKVIAISNFIKDLILKNYKINEDKIKVIHRCVDVEKFSAEKIPNARVIEIARKINIDETKKIILMPARITRWKGHEILIKALKDVKYDDYVCIKCRKSRK
jgi:glycosyltransferase involved in cell wall biosynthesis